MAVAESSQQHLGRLCRLLSTRRQDLYAVVDAARSPLILPLLRKSQQRYETLYSGSAATELAEYAPYLVYLPKDCALLARLLAEGWHDAWGYYVLTDDPFPALRLHLRKFLMVQLADGRQVYFRFYDPRVIRVFLELCTPEQGHAFFRPLAGLVAPSERPGSVQTWHMQAGRLLSSELSIADITGSSRDVEA